MRITKRNIIKGAKTFYVVTRGGRRVEEENYQTKADATYRAQQLIEMLKDWDPNEAGSVGIVYTSKPRAIY